MHHTQNTLRQTSFLQQLCNQQGRARVTLRGFKDETVTAHNGQRVHPQRNHRRKVKRRNACNYTNWLKVRPRINVRPYVPTVLALQNLRRRTRILNVFDPTLELTGGIFERLAMLFADQLGDTCFILLQQLLEAKHDLGPLGRRRVTPSRKCCLGCINGFLDSFAAGQRHLMNHFACRWVKHIRSTTGVTHHLAIDQMLNRAHWGSK